MKFLRLIFFILVTNSIVAQVKTDSLLKIWRNPEAHDTVRLKALHYAITKYYVSAKPDSAIFYAKMELDYSEKTGNKKQMALALTALGVAHERKSLFKEALDYYTKSYQVFIQLPYDPGRANALQNIAIIHRKTGNLVKSLETHRTALELKVANKDQENIPYSLQSIGFTLSDLGKFDEAEDYFYRGLKLFNQRNELKEQANTHNSLGLVKVSKSELDSALVHFEICKNINTKISNQQGLLICILNTGMVYEKMGEYEKALDIYLYKLEEPGKSLSSKAIAYGNIGNVYRIVGDYPKAFAYLEKSLGIRQKIGDKKGIAVCYNGLGNLYMKQFNYELGKEYFNKSIAIYKEIGDLHGLAIAKHNLGNYYLFQNEYTQALELFEETKTIRQKLGDKEGVAAAISNIGLIKVNQGKYSDAMPILEEGLRLHSDINNKQGQILMFNQIGVLYSKQDDHKSALRFYKNAAALSFESGMKPEYRSALASLASEYFQLDSAKQSVSMVLSLRESIYEDIGRNYLSLSDFEKTIYSTEIEKGVSIINDLTEKHKKNYPYLVDSCFNLNILVKNLSLKSGRNIRASILESKDTTLLREYNKWLGINKSLAKSSMDAQNTSNLLEKRNDLERLLMKKSKAFEDIKYLTRSNWIEIKNKLNNNETIIDFVNYKSKTDSTENTIYAAYLVKKSSEHPVFIQVCKESDLADLIDQRSDNPLEYINSLYGTRKTPKDGLYETIWKSVEPYLDGIESVYISPSGLLHKIAFSAITTPKNESLSKKFKIQQVNSLNEIKSKNDWDFLSTDTTLLFGGIRYDSDSTKEIVWRYLPSSDSEISKIEKILSAKKYKVSSFRNNLATEESLKSRVKSANILHIATHGFFFPDPEASVNTEKHISSSKTQTHSVELNNIVFRGANKYADANFIRNKNPLMRAGLALAYANDIWSRDPLNSIEDGVLTAAEVSDLDLRNTQLVVLSACETGLGDIKGSEGVYGLQRAFKMAGVKYMIMSLWQVPDKETAEFMTTFYQHLVKCKDIRIAFQITQKTMREKHDPYYWAAFTLIE